MPNPTNNQRDTKRSSFRHNEEVRTSAKKSLLWCAVTFVLLLGSAVAMWVLKGKLEAAPYMAEYMPLMHLAMGGVFALPTLGLLAKAGKAYGVLKSTRN